jgi:hypothetical protein
MTVTQKEAQTKWCPMVRHSEDGAGNCIGSECMMWMWSVTRESTKYSGGGRTPPMSAPGDELPKEEWQWS